MRSQIYYQCIASANSPLALVKQGLEEFILGFGVDPAKLVLGVPWYGYKYGCVSPATRVSGDAASTGGGGDQICVLEPVCAVRLVCAHACSRCGCGCGYGRVRVVVVWLLPMYFVCLRLVLLLAVPLPVAAAAAACSLYGGSGGGSGDNAGAGGTTATVGGWCGAPSTD